MYSSDGLEEILAVKVETTGLWAQEQGVLLDGQEKSINNGIFHYLASNPMFCGDDTQHKGRTKQEKDSRSVTGLLLFR